MLKLHVLLVVYLQLQSRCVYGSSVAEQLQETTQLCCDRGKLHIRSNMTDCSAADLPDVPNSLTSICTFAMNACCMDYLEKKRNCDAGITLASDTNRCDSLKQLAESCCSNCLRGKATGSRGEQGCTEMADGGNDEEQLSAGANSLCCKQAAREISAKATKEEQERGYERTSTTVSVFNRKREELFSVCDEYSPHELCAHHCIPIPGSYKCVCNDGFRLMRDGKNCMEVTKNRCKHNNMCEHKCNDNGVEVKCSCRRGYELMSDGKSCQDIDECSLNPPVCLSGSQCFNLQGTYKCVTDKIESPRGQCPPGYKTNVSNGACDDINECELMHPPCQPYLCENTVGSYKCGGRLGNPVNFANNPKPQVEDRCPQGFRTGLDEKCEDVNECDLHKDNCNPLSQFCINMRGTFHCQDMNSTHCPPGFHINPKTHRCEDTDECEDEQNVCPEGYVCFNTLGEFDCVLRTNYLSEHTRCPEGMRAKPGTSVCEDIDECVEGIHLCDSLQNCLNMNGSYECNCKIGYHLDNTIGSCVDINECATGQHNCIQRAQRCDNTIGSFLCIRILSCGTGYVLQHTTGMCEDIDECALGTHDCDRAGSEYQCVNIPGAFSCEKHKSTPNPEPEYYDSEEYYDEEDNTTITNTGKSQPITTTTLRSEPSIENQVTTPRYIPTEKPAEPNQDTTTTDNTPEINVKDNEIDSGPLESNNRELNPIRPTEDTAPTQPPSYVYDPIYPAPETPNYPNSIKDTEITETPDTRYNTVPKIDITENSSPTIIYLPEGQETATVKADRTDDGAVVVDTQNVPKNDWTNINNRPMDCQPGFEMDDYGACFDIDECATLRHHCSGMTEVCRNTMGGYICDCAVGFRRNIASGACDLIAITPSTTNIPGVQPPSPPEINPPYLETTTSPPPTTPPPPPTTPSPPPTTPPPPPTTPPPPQTTPPLPSTTLPPPSTTPPPPPTTPSPPPITPPPPPTTSSPPPTTPPPPPTTSTETYFYGYLDRRNYTPRPFRAHSTCDAGFHYNSRSRTCEDIDECTNGQANCASVEICVNTEGGYRCECPPNWVLDEVKHRCVPNRSRGRFPPGYENKPAYPSVLVVNQGNRERYQPEVTKLGEGSVIRCPWGFKVAHDNSCEDIDECATGQARCGPDQICVNSAGGYTCRCPPGHRLTADHVCEDVDECALARNRPICSQNADCVNTIGSYKCVCHSGFIPAPANDKVCIDVDECTETRPGSLCQHRCNNVWGGYRCSCFKGYRLNADNRTCSDVDECEEYKSKRLCIGYCQNEPGSYRCTCPSGYRLSGDKKSCIDINECETGEAPCANSDVYAVGSNDVCLNTRGGYRCQRITCLPGYRLEDRHRCKRIEHYCPPTDWDCIHQPTSYSYHFITFVSNLYIPDGKVYLFTMRGPKWADARMKFSLRLVSVNAPPTVKEKADFNAFLLVQTSNEAMLSLTKPLIGPQSIELELSMELYASDLFGGIAVAKLYIFVSEHEF